MSTEIHGFCDPKFTPFRDAFAANFADGLELGASFAATWRGELVVDLWAGYADLERSQPWQRDTLVMVASTTKVMVIIAALMMIERGKLELDAPVARYWPEFAQGGKGHVTVRDALTHQGGVPGFDVRISDDELCDWEKVTARLAAEPHWFGGERQICYHFGTYGTLIGELVRRADGRGPRQFLSEELFAKTGADWLIGLTREAAERTAQLAMPENAWEGEGMLKRMIDSIDMSTGHTWQRLSAELPSGNGFTNGRGIALACTAIANGGIAGGERLLKPETIALAGQEHAHGRDCYLGMLRLGLGLGIDSEYFPAPTATTMHWGGYGGSEALMDPVSRISMGYAPNNWEVPDLPDGQITIDPRNGRFFDAFRAIAATV